MPNLLHTMHSSSWYSAPASSFPSKQEIVETTFRLVRRSGSALPIQVSTGNSNSFPSPSDLLETTVRRSLAVEGKSPFPYTSTAFPQPTDLTPTTFGRLTRRSGGDGSLAPPLIPIAAILGCIFVVVLIWLCAKRSNADAHATRRNAGRRQGWEKHRTGGGRPRQHQSWYGRPQGYEQSQTGRTVRSGRTQGYGDGGYGGLSGTHAQIPRSQMARAEANYGPMPTRPSQVHDGGSYC